MTEMANDDDERHGSSRCSIDDDGEDLPRMLVVSQVPGAVFEHQSSQVAYLFFISFFIARWPTFVSWPHSFGFCHPNIIRSVIILIIIKVTRIEVM